MIDFNYPDNQGDNYIEKIWPLSTFKKVEIRCGPYKLGRKYNNMLLLNFARCLRM